MPDRIIKDALERFDHSQSGSSHNREHALEDIRFARLSEQWPAEIVKQRRLEGRPCLTVNRLPSFIRQVVNDARQNKPGLNVVPVDGGADYDTAQIIAGLLRAIERGSNAGVAYDTAIEHAVTAGFGFFRVTTDYCHGETFDQECRIERVPNPLSVHWDTNSTAFDASDWEYAFVSDDLTEAEFKRRYPKAKPVSFEAGHGDDALNDWVGQNKVRVAEYWLRTEKKRKIVLLSDGSVMKLDDLNALVPVEVMPGAMAEVPARVAMEIAGVSVVREREASYHEVKQRFISGVEVLSEADWGGSMIPICPVWGEEVFFEGRRYFKSLVRDARDPQSMLNFWRSASTELVALAPRAPFLVQEGSIPDGAEGAKWQSANTRSHAYLTYRGPMMPQRQSFAGVPAGALQEALNAADDMKSVIGIYDASLGARSNETSGRAIMARQRESDVATFHFVDNLSRAIQYMGRCLVEVIPSVYSTRQAIQILGEDEAPKIVQLGQRSGVAPTPEDPDGKLYDMSVGRYDVAVKVGPSYATQREETREVLMELINRQPGAALVLGDLLVKNIDAPGMEEAAKRIQLLQKMELVKMGLPPDVDQAIAAIEQQGAAPPGAMPVDPMQGAPQGALPVSGGM